METIYNTAGDYFQISDPELGLERREEFVNACCFPQFTADPQVYQLVKKDLSNGGQELFLLKGRSRFGQSVVVSAGQKILSERFYKSDRLHGPSRFYCEDRGNLLAQGWFINGLQQGRNHQYYSCGALYSETLFLDGRFHGVQRYYFASGQIKSLIPYKNGLLEGAVEQFFENGTLFRRVEFKDNLRQGLESQFALDGKPAFMCYYKGDVPVQESKSWHSSGELYEHYRYKDAPWRYDLDKYDETGKKWLEGVYHDNGQYEEKIFSRSGKLIEHKIYSRCEEQWKVHKVLISSSLEGV